MKPKFGFVRLEQQRYHSSIRSPRPRRGKPWCNGNLHERLYAAFCIVVFRFYASQSRPPSSANQDQSQEVTAMISEMRRSGVEVVGDMPWGTHFCLFYETKADLLETLVSYCKAGLESDEFCLWVVAEPL
ncbi:MAG TPA: MEDS domain-containing protein, partial [Candidatus Angelobacter sp.]|nr:MEDS domain-containing protein [Candidatus Angelobacter sp.]